MTKIISFISRKGGTGKTTSAINLCTMMHNLGHQIVLVETDTNYTLSTLRKMELFKTGAKDEALFKILGSEDPAILEDIEKIKGEWSPDFIIIDSAGKTTDQHIRKLSTVSDLVIIPTSLTQNDLLVTYQTVEDLKPAKEVKGSLKIIILPNRVHSLTKIETIKDALGQLDAEILDEKIPAKNLFANFSTILPEKEFLPITKKILAHLSKD